MPNKIVSHVRQDYTISISWAEGSESSVRLSSNGSWFCPMMCLILTPSFFLGSTGQGVQQAVTGCSQMNPEMPLLWQRLATSIREAMHVTGVCLEPSYQFSSERIIRKRTVKRKKEAQFQILTHWGITVMKGPLIHLGIWMRWLIGAKTGTKRVPTVVALATLHEVFHDLEV